MKRNITPYLVIALVLIGNWWWSRPAAAHNPQVVNTETSIAVTNPEISKAYYGQLTGQPAHYRFTAAAEFALYVNILVPDIASETEDFTVVIRRDGVEIKTLEPAAVTWQRFNEPFGGDVYRQGPEYQATGQPGIYDLTVSSPDNQGKYILAIGETESFPLTEFIRTMKELVGVKHYFEKPGLAIFQSPFIYGPSIALLVVIGVIAGVIIRRRRQKAVT